MFEESPMMRVGFGLLFATLGMGIIVTIWIIVGAISNDIHIREYTSEYSPASGICVSYDSKSVSRYSAVGTVRRYVGEESIYYINLRCDNHLVKYQIAEADYHYWDVGDEVLIQDSWEVADWSVI